MSAKVKKNSQELELKQRFGPFGSVAPKAKHVKTVKHPRAQERLEQCLSPRGSSHVGLEMMRGVRRPTATDSVPQGQKQKVAARRAWGERLSQKNHLGALPWRSLLQ